MKMKRTTILVLGVLLTASFAAAAGIPGSEYTWLRSRYAIESTEDVPKATYTVIETLDADPRHRSRTLFTDADGRTLVAEIYTKGGREEVYESSRWASFGSMGDRNLLRLTVVASNVDIRYGNERVVYELGPEIPGEALPALQRIRESLDSDLRAALTAMIRVGLYREPAFSPEARVLAQGLFPEIDIPDGPKPKQRTEVISTTRFNPAEHPALPGELAFGALYQLPIRTNTGGVRPASQTVPKRGD